MCWLMPITPAAPEAETGKSQVQSQSGLHSETSFTLSAPPSSSLFPLDRKTDTFHKLCRLIFRESLTSD